MSKQFIITVATLLVIAVGALIAVFLVKGYTFSAKEGRLVGTGIISVTSLPDGASVYIDGHLTTATNTTVSQLQPKTYKLRIVKEGFIPWEKEVKVAEGLVSEVKATLFPALPTIYPLTVNGVAGPMLSADGQKLSFAVPFIADSHSRQKGGIWVWTMTSAPLSFARSAEPHQIVASTSTLDFSKAKMRFSPDSTQLLVTLQEDDKPGDANTRNYLLPVDRQTSVTDLKDITPQITSILKEWSDDHKTKEDILVSNIRNLDIRQIASASATLALKEATPSSIVKWSPDEAKFIIESQGSNGTILRSGKVYDLASEGLGSKQPTNRLGQGNQTSGAALTGNKQYSLPSAKAYYWLPDSKHIIIVGEDKIGVAELDGSNVAEIYAGKFDNNLVFPWPDSSRLVIMTSFATSTASQPNLFGINLK